MMHWRERREPVVFIRESLADEAEIAAAEKYFPVITRRSLVPHGSLVIPRYSALPFNREFELDVDTLGGRLINSSFAHSQLADIESWYYCLQDLTPTTWFSLQDARYCSGPFVLKGVTNSKKWNFATHMYAETWDGAVKVHERLLNDGFIGEQKICIRRYMPLRKLCDSISSSGPPVSEEYRFFVFRRKIIASGFYWSTYMDDILEEISPSFVPEAFLAEVLERVGDIAPFIVVDVARTADDAWIVVELNDGQQSGLCSIDPDDLYRNLRSEIDRYQGVL